MRYFFLPFLCFSQLCFGGYQDIYVNGKTISKGGGPDCNSRYEALKPILDMYQRPFSVLDIGASEGYFSFRIAYEYDACCTMIEDTENNSNTLEKLCQDNTQLDKIILLSKKITPQELKRLSDCESFDVVLAFNVIHHFGERWKEAFEAILNMGDNIIIESPPNNDAKSCGQPFLKPVNDRIDQEKFVVLGRFKRHTDPTKFDRMVWIEKKKKTCDCNFFISCSYRDNKLIESDFEKKVLRKKYGNRELLYDWIPGINLITFKCLNGKYPNIPMLMDALHDIANTPSTDWLPHNVIVNGRRLFAIDTNDPGKENVTYLNLKYNPKLLDFMIKIIQAKSQKEVEALYRTLHNYLR